MKIIKPGNKPGKPIVEDYNGERTAKAIVDTVIGKIPNNVKRVDDKSLEAFLAEANDTAKAILFTEKGKTSALMRAVAIEFKGSISVAQIRNTEKASLELFGVSKFPTLLLLPGGKEAEGIVYDGELNKASIVEFLSTSTNIAPNPDPAPPKVKVSKGKDKKKASKKAEESATATSENPEDEATASPDPNAESEKPVDPPEPAKPIDLLFTEHDTVEKCVGARTGTCILALLPSAADAVAARAIGGLSEIAHQARLQGKPLFPFYAIPQENTAYAKLVAAFGLKEGLDIVAINGRRGWWRALPTEGDSIALDDVTMRQLANWVESIKLGEGTKNKIPKGLIREEPVVEEAGEFVIEDTVIVEEVKVEETVVAPEAEATHDEL